MKSILEKIYQRVGRFLGLQAVREWRCLVPVNPNLRIVSTQNTLNACREAIENNRAGAYLRFGDGDIVLAHGKPDLYQTPNPELQREMREAFQCSGENIFKALPLHSEQFGFEPGMVPGVHLASNEQAIGLLRQVAEYFIGERIFSAVALHHQAVSDENYTVRFLRMLKDRTSIVIGSEEISAELLVELFGDVTHIKTPSRNAYDAIETVWLEFQQKACASGCEKESEEDYFVVILAMGCAGRIMAKRILHSSINCFVFDFGSLMDALCEKDTRAWIAMTGAIGGAAQRIRVALRRDE